MNIRRLLIRALTFLGGLYFFLHFVLPARIGGTPGPSGELQGGFQFGLYHEQISDGFVLVGTMALGLGIINLLLVHGSRIAFFRRGFAYSLTLLLGLLLMMVVTVADWRATSRAARETAQLSTLRDFALRIDQDSRAAVSNAPQRPQRIEALKRAAQSEITRQRDSIPQANSLTERQKGSAEEALRSLMLAEQEIGILESSQADLTATAQVLAAAAGAMRDAREKLYETSTTKNAYEFLNYGLFVPLSSSMFALLGFYIAAAAYRAFRVRSSESGLMMAAALVVMLGQIPFGLWISEHLPELRLWLLQTPSAAAARAIEIGASVAGLVMAFRMWLSIETESFKK